MNSSSASCGAPSFGAERVEVVHMSPCVARACSVSELVPARAVGGRVAGEDGRDAGIAQLERVARDDARPRPAGRRDRGEADDVVLDDHVGLQLVEDLAQAVVHVPRAVDQRLPGRLEELRRAARSSACGTRGAVSRMKSFQNWPGSSSTSGGGPSRIRRSSKPFASRFPANDSSTMKTTRWPRSAQHVADADAVVRRPERPLGEEDDGRIAGSPSA